MKPIAVIRFLPGGNEHSLTDQVTQSQVTIGDNALYLVEFC